MSFKLQTMPWKWPRVRDRDDATVSTQVSSWLNFTPLSLQPALWLDAADTASITESGSAVSQWDDKSGNGRHFTQATGANQPTTNANTLNGKNVLTFNGSSHFLQLGTNDLGRNVVGATIYLVYKHDVNPTNSRIVFAVNRNTDAGFARILLDAGVTSQRTRTGGRTLDADSFQSVTGTAVIATSWLFRSSVFDYSNTDLFNYVNGVVDGSTTSFQTGTTTSDTASLSAAIAATTGVPAASFLSGQIAEILVYHTAHTTTQRLTVETYLKAKWGL